jgi:3-oxoacyl-[acyl-carrier-protein] synthase-3
VVASSILISAVSYHVPSQVITNQSIIEANDLRIRSDWVERRLGIRERRWVVAGEEAASDLAVAAIRKLRIDLGAFSGALWTATISPDYYTPSTGSIIKQKLGMLQSFPTFDLNQACAGQIFALECAINRLRATDETEAIVVATEVRSVFLNKMDRRTVFLFGDGASAFYLCKHLSNEDQTGVEAITVSTISLGDDPIKIPAGGSRSPIDADAVAANDHRIKMLDGELITRRALDTLTGEIRSRLAKWGRTISDYDFFVFHQGSGSIIQSVCNDLGIAPEKIWTNFDRFGNTAGASMGIALAEAHELKKIPIGSRVLLVAMGAGWHLGLASVVWSSKHG